MKKQGSKQQGLQLQSMQRQSTNEGQGSSRQCVNRKEAIVKGAKGGNN